MRTTRADNLPVGGSGSGVNAFSAAGATPLCLLCRMCGGTGVRWLFVSLLLRHRAHLVSGAGAPFSVAYLVSRAACLQPAVSGEDERW
jgi:hypothetical protein